MKLFYTLNEYFPVEVGGGKAYNLHALISQNFPVPPGFVIPARTLTHNKAELVTIVKSITTQMPGPYIVRSSGNIEDGRYVSFAGIAESYGPISTEHEILVALEKIQAVRDTHTLHQYLRHYNIDVNEFALSCIVQQWVPSDLSGVLFVETKREHTNIKLEWSTQTTHVVSGKQVKHLILDATKNRTTVTGDEFPSKNSLSSLVVIAKNIEDLFGLPCDIEWMMRNDEVFIVQSRPITTSDFSENRLRHTETQRLEQLLGPIIPNIGEPTLGAGLPYVTPLTLSVFHEMYRPQRGWGTFLKKYHQYHKVRGFSPERFLFTVFGRLYQNQYEDITERALLTDKSLFARIVTIYQNFITRLILEVRTIRRSAPLTRLSTDYGKLFSQLAKQTIGQTASQQLAAYIDFVTNDLAEIIFETSALQTYAKQKLDNFLKPRVPAEVLQDLFRTGIESELTHLTRLVHAEHVPPSALDEYSLYELELSFERFRENQQQLNKYIQMTSGVPTSNSPSIDTLQLTLQAIPSPIDRAVISSYMQLYSNYTGVREKLHDILVRAFSEIRELLLSIDRENHLYNSIWSLKVSAVLGHSYAQSEAFNSYQDLQALARLPINAPIAGQEWSSINKKSPTKKHMEAALAPTMTILSHGRGSGTLGTPEDFYAGKACEIVLTHSLNPSLAPFLPSISGIITEQGGELSHLAIIAREYGIPIVRLPEATHIFHSGNQISIDTSHSNIISSI